MMINLGMRKNNEKEVEKNRIKTKKDFLEKLKHMRYYFYLFKRIYQLLTLSAGWIFITITTILSLLLFWFNVFEKIILF